MSQRLTNSFINTNRPGAYFDVKVRSNPVGVASSGNIVIIGEAAGGAAFGSEVLKDNYFTPDQLDRVVRKYISGPIVDAFRAIASPSSDSNITGSASRIYIAKTNAGSQASAVVASAYGTLKDKNFGVDGNKYFYQITQLEDEVAPSIAGDTIAAMGAAITGAKFSIRANGGVVTVIDVFTGATTAYDSIAEIVALIDAALPAGLNATEGVAANSIQINSDVDAGANASGSGKSFEIIETDAGDLALLGLEEGLVVSSQEPQVQLDIKRTDTNVNESFVVDAAVALLIGYEGTTATITIGSTNLTTTVTGGTGTNLTAKLSDYPTIKDLADYINAQTGYTCSVVAGSNQLPTSALDKVTAVAIASTDAGITPGRIKKAAYNWKTKASQSSSLDFVATAAAGLPNETASVVYLAGGVKGATSGANAVAAINACETIDVNFVVPLFSRNATADIADNLTESASTYTISAVNAATKSHVLKMSTAKIKKHRTAFLSIWDEFSVIQSESSSLANARISLSFQKTSQVDGNGVVQNFLPWHTAAVAAGMQAAGFYKAIVNKFANVISFQDPSGFDSGNPGDVETAIDAGLLFLEKAIVGNKWVSDQTTYGVDTNFVYNSIQAMYAADLVSLDLAASFYTAFGGQSLADVDAGTALSFLASKMDTYKKQKLIAASDDAPLGFINAKIAINGPVLEVSVEIKLATAIYFIPINIDISQVQSAA